MKHRPRTAKTIGVISDLHSGSNAAILPPSWQTPKTGAGPRWLYERFTEMVSQWPHLDLLLLLGDLTDGKNRKSEGVGTITTQLSAQVDMASEILTPVIKKSDIVIRVAGSVYHETEHGEMAQFDEHHGINREYGSRAFVRDIELSRRGAVVNLKHTPEGDAALYRGTVADRELVWSTLAEARGLVPKASILLRGHKHMYYRAEDEHKCIIHCPCWKAQTPYEILRRYYAWHPTIGGLLIQEDEMDSIGYRVTRCTFPMPAARPDRFDDLTKMPRNTREKLAI